MGCGDEDALRWPVDGRAARWHDKTGKAGDVFRGMVELHYPAARDLEEWAYFSQLNQRDALRNGIEHWRRSSFCRGTLVWQLNDCWPVQSWAVLDSEAEPKAAAHELRRLFAPALASLQREGDTFRLWTILDNAREPVRGTALLEARSTRDGAVRGSWQVEIEIAPGERRPVLSADVSGFDAETTILFASFAGSRTFRLLAEAKASRLTDAILVVRVAGDRLVVRASAPVVDLFLWDAGGGLTFADNFLTLATGEVEVPISGTARGELCARSMRGRHTVRAG
jgi:beta-mannosidase